MLALTVLTTACGGRESAPPTVDFTEPATVAPTATDSAPTFEDREFSVDQQFWHSGFRVELGEGQIFAEENQRPGEIRYFVSIAAQFENLGPNETFFDSAVALVANGNSYPTLFKLVFPRVPAGLSSEGELIFEVDPDFSLESAQLVVGSGDENRALIPLGAQGGRLDTLAPSEPAVSGSLSLELIDLRITSAELRADRQMNYSEVEDGKLALTLYFDATSRRGGNWSVRARDFALILPSGNAAVLDGSELGSLLGSAAGRDTTGLYVRFLIDDPPEGSYTLRFTPGSWFISDDGVTEATFSFSLEDRIRGSSQR